MSCKYAPHRTLLTVPPPSLKGLGSPLSGEASYPQIGDRGGKQAPLSRMPGPQCIRDSVGCKCAGSSDTPYYVPTYPNLKGLRSQLSGLITLS